MDLNQTQPDVKESKFVGWVFGAKSQGGANSKGDLGGVYENANNAEQKALIKTDTHKPSANISEVMSSCIFARTAEGVGAKVDFIKPKGQDTSPPYVVSYFNPKYDKDLFKDMESVSGKIYTERPRNMGIKEKLFNTFTKAFKKGNYIGLEKVLATSLLICDFDVHVGNIGCLKPDAEGKKYLTRIDFGGAFVNLTSEIHPDSHSRHPFGFRPTNHFREFPRELRFSEEFGDHILKDINMDKVLAGIQDGFDKIDQFYSKDNKEHDAIVQQFFSKALSNRDLTNLNRDQMKQEFINMMKERVQSQRQLGLQVKLGFIVQLPLDQQKTALENLCKAYPEDVKILLNNKNTFKFRHKDLPEKDKIHILNQLQNTWGTTKSVTSIAKLSNAALQEKAIKNLIQKLSNIAGSSTEDEAKIQELKNFLELQRDNFKDMATFYKQTKTSIKISPKMQTQLTIILMNIAIIQERLDNKSPKNKELDEIVKHLTDTFGKKILKNLFFSHESYLIKEKIYARQKARDIHKEVPAMQAQIVKKPSVKISPTEQQQKAHDALQNAYEDINQAMPHLKPKSPQASTPSPSINASAITGQSKASDSLKKVNSGIKLQKQEFTFEQKKICDDCLFSHQNKFNTNEAIKTLQKNNLPFTVISPNQDTVPYTLNITDKKNTTVALYARDESGNILKNQSFFAIDFNKNGKVEKMNFGEHELSSVQRASNGRAYIIVENKEIFLPISYNKLEQYTQEMRVAKINAITIECKALNEAKITHKISPDMLKMIDKNTGIKDITNILKNNQNIEVSDTINKKLLNNQKEID